MSDQASEILDHVARRVARTSNRLQRRETRFFGRAEELGRLDAALAAHPMVTLVGPPGCGKTRLATELASRRSDAGERVQIVDLTAANDVEGLVHAIGTELDLALGTGLDATTSVARIGQVLAHCGPLLLVCDNFEQLVGEAADVLVGWSRDAASLRLLVTSREALAVEPEVRVTLGALDDDSARALFHDRAARARGLDAAAPAEDADVAALVERLGHNPLAIELAAGRADVLGARAVLARLPDDLGVLGSARRDVPDKHRSVRAAVEWSWELLGEDEQHLLAGCLVFRAPFTVDAAEEVLAPGDERLLDGLQSLVSKSLLRSSRIPAGDIVLAPYPIVRVCVEELAPSISDEVRGRHARRHLARAREGRIERAQLEDVLSALRHALATTPDAGAAAAIAIARALELVGPFELRVRVLGEALEAVEDAQPRAELLCARAEALMTHGLVERARPDLEQLGDLLDEVDDDALRARAAMYAALGATSEGRHEASARQLAAARGHLEDAEAKLEAQMYEGLDRCAAGRHEEACRSLAETLRAARVARSERLIGRLENNYGTVLQLAGDLDAAAERYEAALAYAATHQQPFLYVIAQLSLLSVRIERGEPAAALEMADAIGAGQLDERLRAYDALYRVALADLIDDPEALAAQLDRARREVRALSSAALEEALAIYEGFGDLAEARAHARRDDADAADEARARAEARLEAEASGIDPRVARGLLERALERQPALLPFEVGPEGRWFRWPGGERIELGRRKILRQLLDRLAERRLEDPGGEVGRHELMKAGWPGQRIREVSATHRIQVAMSDLRKLGLRDILLTGPDGYYLDPDVRLSRASS